MVVSANSARLKTDCFHTLGSPPVTADSKGFIYYLLSYYSQQFDGIRGDNCVRGSHYGLFPRAGPALALL